MKIQGAIFDMDGTLVDSLYFWDFFWKSIKENHLVDADAYWTPETEKAMRTVPFNQAISLLHKDCEFYCSEEELLQHGNELCVDFYRNTVEIKAGVMEFLEACREKGIKMCVASATEKTLLKVVMDRFGFDDYLPKVISCHDIGVGKDRPDVFDAAREYLGTPLEETWVFEDSVVAIETAVKAGYKTVGIYDVHAFDFDRIEQISDECICDGESMTKLISKLNV